MADQIPIDESARADLDGDAEGGVHEVLADIAYQRLVLVNVVYLGAPTAGDRGWVLVDAGVAGSAGTIRRAATRRFGADARPAAIVLTHAHFDHVGALETLAEEWDVPIWAHRLEVPYLDGSRAYPPPDPKVGGGLMARLAPLYPRGPVDVRARIRVLPEDGAVPGLAGWQWVHTPGHTEGHVSLWRAADRTLVTGDAVITTAQESAYAVLTQREEVHGPPQYFTPDWASARRSVERLAALEPELLVTMHGRALRGAPMRRALHELARRFDEVAVPAQGRYVDDVRGAS
jgi:glyoxylase-like metal-dependent hydrolase (beta-lactamase superfamily II)